MRKLIEIVGTGVALACIFWVLGHLIIFYFFGHILMGEANKLILLVEIVLVSLGLLCFLTDLWLKANKN